MRRFPSVLFATFALVALPAAAHAEDEAPKKVDLSGFVDTSIFFPVTGFDDKGVVLGLDQVELDITVSPTDGLTIQTDLNWMPAAGISTFDDVVEQGFVKYVFGGEDTGFFLQAGKRNAPVGTEAVDAPDMYQYSHSLLFDMAAPTNLTGFFLGYESGGSGIGGQVFVTNQWDTSSTPANATVGGRVDYGFDGGGVGLVTIIGPVADDEFHVLVDVDANLAAGIFTGFLNVNLGMYDGETGFGVSAKGNIATSDDTSVTGRFSYLDRSKLGASPVGTAYKGIELTGAFNFTLTKNFIGIVEVRADIPDEGDTSVGAAVELTGMF